MLTARVPSRRGLGMVAGSPDEYPAGRPVTAHPVVHEASTGPLNCRSMVSGRPSLPVLSSSVALTRVAVVATNDGLGAVVMLGVVDGVPVGTAGGSVAAE